ncbi:MAG TPA: trigger factor [Limnochordia bacterium]|nr:trigger factor [Limnochordia bacterium]
MPTGQTAAVERLEKSRVKLEITVEQAEIDTALEAAYRRVAKQVNIPGFRKGKAPRVIVERHVGREAIRQEALETLVPDAYNRAVEEAKIEPVAQPEVDLVAYDEGEPLRFTATVDVRPDVQLGEYKGLAAVKEIEKVEESDVEHALWHLQERGAELVDTERDEVKDGDFATIDFEGFIDGTPFAGGKAEDQVLEIGSGRMIPGFEQQLVGAKVGEERTIQVTFPEDYRAENLAGKAAEFKVQIKALKEKRVPALDDEFAKDVSDFATLDELKADIRNRLEQDAAERANGEVRERLAREAAEKATMEIPESLVEREAMRAVERFAQRLAQQSINPDEYLKSTNPTVEQLRDRFKPDAVQDLRIRLTLEAVAKAEGIEVGEAEVQANLDQEVARYVEAGYPEPDVRKQLDTAAQREAIQRNLAIQRALDLIVEQAAIETVEVASKGHGHQHHDHAHDDEHDHEHEHEHGHDHDHAEAPEAEEPKA